MKQIKHKQFEGKEINGYKIFKAIGQGKFSTVYSGENSQGVPIAVKEVKIFDMMDPKQRQKCLKEVELMKPLEHPNIIQYIDSFTYNNQLIIITEWASKGDLKKLIKAHIEEQLPFDEIKIWQYIIQIASALKHMHEKKIMHRDLKPANIFISADNSLKVGDLGLGRAFTSQTLEAHSKVGTPLYMAPELLSEEGYQFNVDIWSLGCIAYEMAEFRSPFRNQNQKLSLMDLFNNITRGQFKPVSSKYSPELADIINKMIVINPDKRLSSAKVLEIAESNFSRVNKNPRLDCFITMQDIVNKLNLLDYAGFCKLSGNKPINKFYFALEDKTIQNGQFYLFLEICYWLMNLSKPDRNRQKCVTQAKSMIDWKGPQEACTKFLKDIQSFGIRTQIDPKYILQSYGQGVCYLLNQLLTRELIRINFKFMTAEQAVHQDQQSDVPMLDVEQDDRLIKPDPKVQEDIEQTHDFQRSLVFKRGARKPQKGNTQLLQKIKQIEQDQYNIIYSKVDPKDWEVELIRVQRKLADIGQHLKEARKKSLFQNFERTRSVSARIAQYTKFLKPLSYKLYTNIQSDLKAIQQGQSLINNTAQKFKSEYSEQNHERIIMTERLGKLTSMAKDQMSELQRISQRIDELRQLSDNVGNNSHEQSVVRIRQSIANLRKQIRIADVNIELQSWQIRQYQKGESEKDTQIVYQEEF